MMDAAAAGRLVRDSGVHSVRVVFADQHGSLKGKSIAASELPAAFDRGIGVPSSLLHKDTGNTYAIPVWEPSGNPTLDAFLGARNIIMRPDPATLRILPWTDGTALVLSDLETLEGRPVPLSTRSLCALAVADLADQGYDFVAGLELEFHLFGVDPAGGFEHSHPGWDHLGENHLDRIDPIIEPIRRGLAAFGFPPSSVEAELGPSQIEMTFAPARGLDVADQAVLVRSAIKHLARRLGFHATFMSRPALQRESFPSGWHLHQSLSAHRIAPSPQPTSGSTTAPESAFMPSAADETLSEIGRQWIAGLLRHAAASSMLVTPTVTGYKRYRPKAVTPDRVTWSLEHRGAMLRVVGGPDDPATRVENRAGDPAANPYLYVASQIISGVDGLEQRLTPPPPADDPYQRAAGELLPRSLGQAIEAFAASPLYRRVWGEDVVDYFANLKRSEWGRFLSAVTDWEQREYFDLF